MEKVKSLLRQGKVAALAQWAKENKVRNIEALIDQAYRELQREGVGNGKNK